MLNFSEDVAVVMDDGGEEGDLVEDIADRQEEDGMMMIIGEDHRFEDLAHQYMVKRFAG